MTMGEARGESTMPFRPLTPKEKETERVNACSHREHNPPTNIVLRPGLHVWVCPGCGKEMRLNVPQIRC